MSAYMRISSKHQRNFLEIYWSELLSSLRKFMSFLTVSSLFIGTVGFFKATIIYIILGSTPDIRICIAVFLHVFGIYSLDRLTDSKEDVINMPERGEFIKGHRKIIFATSIASCLLSALIVLSIKPWALPLMLFPIASNVVYGSRISPHLPRLKDIPVMKNLLVAFTWAIGVTGLTAWGDADVCEIAFIFYFLLAKSFINTVLYDIRDLEGDRRSGVRTIPVLLGQKWTAVILLVLNSTLLPCLMLAARSWQPLAFCLVLYGYVYILFFNKGGNKNALDLCVDGEWMIAYLILVTFSQAGWMLPSLYSF
jgi:4-hydroxybenzoate polyprenyltransferase